MTIFDAPTRESCVVRRQTSSTPLQALALLNDEMYIETARKLAERMMHEGGTTAASRLAWAFRLATARTPAAGEVAILEAGLIRRLAQYRGDRGAAETYQRQLDIAEAMALRQAGPDSTITSHGIVVHRPTA